LDFLNSASLDTFSRHVRAFRQGLKDTGYVEGEYVAIEYRWAENQPDRLPSLVAELIHQQVSVIAALTTPSAIAAKVATATIPIVFTTIGDPVQIGLVASLSRPGGNLTGVTILSVEIVPKMLDYCIRWFLRRPRRPFSSTRRIPMPRPYLQVCRSLRAR
jgi:ABC-type uncharacterized transport system substrate-binding protein